MAYNLSDFSCGDRGGGNGAKLLYFALNYVTDDANIPRKNQPFRIDLSVVPESTGENNFTKLMNYYKRLGFEIDNDMQRKGVNNAMFAIVFNLKNTLRQQIEKKGGRKTRNGKHSRRHRSTRKHKK